LITLIISGRMTGSSTKQREERTMIPTTAKSQKATTSSELNNAKNLGSAEVPELAKEADGAPAMTDVREPHFQCKLQVFLPITDSKVIEFLLSEPKIFKMVLPSLYL